MDDPLQPFASAPEARPRWPRRRILAIALLLALLPLLWLSWALPVNRALEPLPKPTLVLLDRHGEAYARRGALKLEPVDSRHLPRHVVDAVLAIEDRRFYRHDGIDPRGIARALWHNARAGAMEQGGSTITQQLAKTSFLTPDRTLRRKLQEAAIALWLEARLDKDEILSRYLSSIYFGDGVYGLRAAARHYFGVEPEQLDLAQAAMLAGLPKAPSALAPTAHPEAAEARMRLVLAAMVAQGRLDARKAEAIGAPEVLGADDELPVGSYFADWVSPQAREEFDSAYGELPVHTTLDLRLQSAAERALAKHEGEGQGASQAAIVAMHPDGEIVAMVGGREYAASPFNRATQARRQPGSAFKPFVYYAALREGLAPTDTVEDTPVELAGWTPANYNDEYRGTLTVREAFARSSNVAAVRIAQRVGAREVARTAREFGIESELGDDASIALGSYETTLLELTSAYAAFAAGAAPVRPHGLLDHAPNGVRRPLDPQAQAAMLELLRAVVQDGTGRNARLRVPAFGKTGTTQDYRDALFVGMAGDLVVGVWVGNDDNKPMQGVTGGTLPALIWRDFMVAALGTQAAAPWTAVSERRGSRIERTFSRFTDRLRRPFHSRGNGHGRGKAKGRGKKQR
jgi:penicillin-binding protein 1A